MGELSFAPTCSHASPDHPSPVEPISPPSYAHLKIGRSVVQPDQFARHSPRCAYGGGGGYRPRVQTISYRGHQLLSVAMLGSIKHEVKREALSAHQAPLAVHGDEFGVIEGRRCRVDVSGNMLEEAPRIERAISFLFG